MTSLSLISKMSTPARVTEMNWPSQMPDDEWAEVAQGIPTKDEPFINKYLSGREALIAQERQQRSGEYPTITSRRISVTNCRRPCFSLLALSSGQRSLLHRRSNPQ